MSNLPDLAAVEASFFEPLLHEKFSAQLWDENKTPVFLSFELVGVVPARWPGPPGRRAPFSLFFSGPAGAALEQSIYDLYHAATGQMALFLVPVQDQGDRLRFEAVFN